MGEGLARGTDLLDGGVASAVGQAAQDAALRHLEAGGHRGDAGQHGGQARHVRLHVAQQLLQLVQDCRREGEGVGNPLTGGWGLLTRLCHCTGGWQGWGWDTPHLALPGLRSRLATREQGGVPHCREEGKTL